MKLVVRPELYERAKRIMSAVKRKRGTTRDMMVKPMAMFPSAGLPSVPFTVNLGVPPPRCTSDPPCNHCWYCEVWRVQNSVSR